MRRTLLGSLALLLAVAASAAGAAPVLRGITALDSFLCYKAKATKGAATSSPPALTLVDDFESRATQVVKPVAAASCRDRARWSATRSR